MPESTDPDPWWVASLSRVLRSTEPRTEGPLTLLELADKLESWAAGSRVSAWQRNRASLITEIAATASEVAQWGDKAMLALLDEVGRSVKDAAVLDSVARERILHAVGEARIAVTSVEAIRAQGRRLVTMARNEDEPLANLASARELLDDQIEANGGDPRYVLMDASWRLDKDRGLDRKLEMLEPRILAYLDSLSRQRDAVPVIVWLGYENAEINPDCVSSGPLTFFSGRWAVAGARANGPHDFPFRAELAAYLDSPGSNFPDPEHDHGKVLVRVDLGVRHTYGAVEDAAEMVAAIIDIAIDRVSGERWKPFGVASLEIDSDFLRGGFQRFGDFERDSSHRLDREETGGEIARWAERLGPPLSTGGMPALLREALSLLAARNLIEEDGRGPTFGRLRERNLRNATAMDAQIVEAVAGWAGMETSDLEDALRTEWIEGRWQGHIGQTLQVAIWESRRSNGREGWELERTLSGKSDGRDVLLLGRALDNERVVLDSLKDPHDRRRGETVIAALRDPDAFDQLYADGMTHLELGLARARRARNAVTHGNPVVLSVVARSRPLARHLSSGAIDLALRSLLEEKNLSEFLEQRATKRRQDVTEFQAGTPWSTIWDRPESDE